MEPEENWAEADEVLQTSTKVPVFLSPFVPGVNEDLKKIATKYQLTSWYTYPGRPMDLFTKHRGRQHSSKSQNSIYCAMCSCGTQYIGESNRNLKVRLNEHLNKSSVTAFSMHLNPSRRKQQQVRQTRQLTRSQNSQRSATESASQEQQQPVHIPIWKNTVVLGNERNGRNDP